MERVKLNCVEPQHILRYIKASEESMSSSYPNIEAEVDKATFELP